VKLPRLSTLWAFAAALALCAAGCLARPGFADEIREAEPAAAIGSPWTLERFTTYPFKTRADLSRVHNAAMALRNQLASGSDAHEGDVDSFLYEVAAFTDPDTSAGEQVEIVSFASSPDPALARLRDAVRLPPPPGGAVVRRYGTKEDMPGPVRSLFGPDTAGITHWSRYVAVLTDERSVQEIADTVSHELVHAYLLSILGPEGGGLPRWFHEGAALYLSGGRVQYVSTSDFGRERVSYSPRDYNEFRLVFRYLERVHGTPAVHEFVRDAVLKGDFEKPLLAVSGVSDYRVLSQDAWGWHRRQSAYKALAVLAAVAALAGVGVWLSRRRGVRVEQALALVEEARMLARVGLRQEALENLEQARALEPYLARVRMAIQQVEDELDRVTR